MLDIKFIHENEDKVREAIKQKKIEVNLDELFKLEKQKNESIQQVDQLRNERKKAASEKNVALGKEIKEKLAKTEPGLKEQEEKFKELLIKVPNIISDDTPIGPDESGNKSLRKNREPNKFDFEPKDHMKLGKSLNLIDTDRSAIISGARFNYLFNEAVLLQFALINFVFATLTDKKIIGELAKKVGNPSAKVFSPVLPPVIAKAEIMKKMDRFDPLEDRYYLKEDDSLLIGSAEHTLGPIHMDETLEEKDLPIRYIGYSTAFRREAGTYGKDATGILRRHQFDKAEMETFIQPEYGLVEQDFIVAVQEYLVDQLDIPYQVVAICTGDMGKPDFRQIDIECFLPGEGKYRETHTSDYMTDYQARRLSIKYKNKEGKKGLVHMNDATAFAMGRTLIAILENYQQKDGSIKVPKVLWPYMHGIKEISAKK